jgi:hypothetical protein
MVGKRFREAVLELCGVGAGRPAAQNASFYCTEIENIEKKQFDCKPAAFDCTACNISISRFEGD